MCLDIKYKELLKTPFPHDSSNDEELSNVFFELELFDDYVCGTVDKILRSGRKCIVDYDVSLEKRLEEILKRTTDAEVKTIGQSYYDYLMKIKDLIDCVK